MCGGITNRYALDNPGLSLKQISFELTLAFKNDELMVTIPQNAYDLENIDSLNPNDQSRVALIEIVSIQMSYMFHLFILSLNKCSFLIIYYNIQTRG